MIGLNPFGMVLAAVEVQLRVMARRPRQEDVHVHQLAGPPWHSALLQGADSHASTLQEGGLVRPAVRGSPLAVNVPAALVQPAEVADACDREVPIPDLVDLRHQLVHGLKGHGEEGDLPVLRIVQTMPCLR